MKPALLLLAWLLLSLAAPADEAWEQAQALRRSAVDTVFRESLDIHWLGEGERLWYAVKSGPHAREFVLVDSRRGVLKRASSGAALGVEMGPLPRKSLASDERTHLKFVNHRSEAVAVFWLNFEGKQEPSGEIAPGGALTQRTFVGHRFLITNGHGGELALAEGQPEDSEFIITPEMSLAAPDQPERPKTNRRWQVRFEQNQVVLRDEETGAQKPLTADGTPEHPYRGPARWSPDGQAFVALSVREVPRHLVNMVESSPPGQVQPRLQTMDYFKPGDELPRPEPVLFRLADPQPIRISSELFPNHFAPNGALEIRWAPDSSEFYFDDNERGHQLYRIVAVSRETAAPRVVVEERSATFIDYTHKTWRRWLEGTGELLWLSERDGWCHLWLYDIASGAVKNQVTRGPWVVREVERLDEAARVVWFLAGGVRPGEDPYHQQLCRANLDGTGFRQLTEGDGNHRVEFSPDGSCFIDTWSRADLPVVNELRRSDDGQLIGALERADVSALVATGWAMPERFVAKGRDGVTDIHGVIIKPAHFDPAKKYPVLERVYAGPHGAFAPKDFGTDWQMHELAELGCLVVQADGMGTNFRGKAFHDFCWKNLADAGFPDRIAWIKAAAATRPWMDLSRVGIYGGSAGGANAMRALLDHGDFYRCAFADCGCHDNRMDKVWWNEQWLGWPVDEAYARNSNVVDAHKLRGSLALCVGELDHNVDPATTLQVVNALEKAGKTFDLIIITGQGHGAAESPYGSMRRAQFFQRELGM